MRYLSVCSGIEAATVAWKPLGWTPVGFSEIDKFPSAVLAHHYPEVPNYGDLTKYQEWPDVSCDLLVGGTPCQSFSVAGLRAGLADPRGNLALTFLGVADRFRPRWLLWENVPGVLSSGRGRDFGAFLGALGQLGYGWAYRSLDAQYFGLAQRRKRVFVVGYHGDWRRAAAVLFERESLRGDSPPRRETGEGVTGTLSSRTSAGGGLGTDFDLGGGVVPVLAFGGNNTSGSIDIATACQAHGGPHGRMDFGSETFLVAATLGTARRGYDVEATYVPIDLRQASRGAKITNNRAIAFSAKDHGADAGDVCPTLRAGGHTRSHANGGVMPAVAFHNRQNPDVSGDVTHPLGAQDNGMAVAFPEPQHGMSVRRLTPRECCRLQGFPDDYLDIIYRGKPAADGPKYKALGNSFAVPVVRWIGKNIQLLDDALDE